LKKIITYNLILLSLIVSCEDVYDPKIDAVENVIVADARIEYGNSFNTIVLSESRGFNEEDLGFLPVSGGKLTIIDNEGGENTLTEIEDGKFMVDFNLNRELSYKLKVEYKGDIFESTFESVPKPPVLDTVYGIVETKIIQSGGENNVNDFREVRGLQLYADILSETENPYYRFTARSIMQYTYPVITYFMGEEIVETMYAWNSYYPMGAFNLASPPEYSNSTEIHKHPLFFLPNRGYVAGDKIFSGWILIMHQHGLSKSAHGYYNDLNNQLESDGKLFDPLYVQARSNIKCTNNNEQLILGNFEISASKEYRYYIKFLSDKLGYYIKPIPYFYDIPLRGEQLSQVPDFWEYPGKEYPDE